MKTIVTLTIKVQVETGQDYAYLVTPEYLLNNEIEYLDVEVIDRDVELIDHDIDADRLVQSRKTNRTSLTDKTPLI